MHNNQITKWFNSTHLPQNLQAVAWKFAELAEFVDKNLPMTAETSACLRKLLEAKDCAVRAAIESSGVTAQEPKTAAQTNA